MKEKFYITTAIPYANAKPHMGHAYEVTLADVIARYKRLRGAQTFFLSGTAEHGEKIICAAADAGMGPQAFVDKNVEEFLDLYGKLNISNDDFIRNSDKKRHWPGAQYLWTKLVESGDIYKKAYKGLYCVGCEKFITEKELVDGKCPDHDKAPKEVEEENYFFRLSKYQDRIIEILKNGEIEILPSSRVNELLSFAKDGLEDISFSRPEGAVPWGIPVPNDPTHMMYVWCEELSNYISALGFGREDDENFKKYWPADMHVVGKDILRFHGIVWPAMLLSAGLPLPKRILVHGMITSDGKKMSKTIGNVVSPYEYIEEFGADPLRAYLVREISPFEDGDFTKDKFLEVYNANLANGLGNLMSRTLKMADQYFDGTISRKLDTDVPLQRSFATVSGEETIQGFSIPYTIINTIMPEYYENMDSSKVNNAADVTWKLIGILDGYITDYEPFKLIKEDKDKTENIIWNILYGLYYVSLMLTPFMPETGDKIYNLLGVSLDDEGTPVSFSTKKIEKPLFERK
jgi:methionyl-tRNA synthetase